MCLCVYGVCLCVYGVCGWKRVSDCDLVREDCALCVAFIERIELYRYILIDRLIDHIAPCSLHCRFTSEMSHEQGSAVRIFIHKRRAKFISEQEHRCARAWQPLIWSPVSKSHGWRDTHAFSTVQFHSKIKIRPLFYKTEKERRRAGVLKHLQIVKSKHIRYFTVFIVIIKICRLF